MTTTQFAFFDVDETLIGLKSMLSFRDYYLRKTLGEQQGEIARKSANQRLLALISQGLTRTEVNRLFWHEFKGHKQAEVQAAVSAWHAQVREQPHYYIPATLNALREHQRNGVEPVFVSGSSHDILQPLAQELGVRHVLANQLEVENGKYTGEILPPQTIGDGKREAIERFLEAKNVSASSCYGYGDHISDLPLLESVGFPCVVAGNSDLEEIAQQRGWPVLATNAMH